MVLKELGLNHLLPLPKLLVEKHLLGLHLQLWGIRDNFDYIILRANCCGEYLNERLPIVATETLSETLDRAVEVCSATFLQLAIMEKEERKEIYGSSTFIN